MSGMRLFALVVAVLHAGIVSAHGAYAHKMARQGGITPGISARAMSSMIPGTNLLGLRGGDGDNDKVADPSGIWQTFQKSSGIEWEGDDDGPMVGYGLSERGPCAWGQSSIVRRTQPKIRLRVTCNETLNEETLVAIGERVGLAGFGNPEGYWEGVRIPLRKTGDIFEAEAVLPPGTYKFKYSITSLQRDGYVRERMTENIEESGNQDRTIIVLAEPPQDALLLVTDIDGTLIGDDGETERFFDVWNRHYKPKGSSLVYNTGRPLYSVMRLISEKRIEVPDALVCSEGTEVYWFEKPWLRHSHEDPVPERDCEWRQILMASWDYPKVKAAIQKILEPHSGFVQKLLFLPDPEYDGGQPMIVIAVEDHGAKDAINNEINRVRKEQDLPFEVTNSCSGGNVWYLLLTPQGAGKGSAALHCADRLGFKPERIMVSGDGENDVPLFQATRNGIKGTMVGNVCDGLKNWVHKKPRENVFQATASHAGGILEGLGHHFQYFNSFITRTFSGPIEPMAQAEVCIVEQGSMGQEVMIEPGTAHEGGGSPAPPAAGPATGPATGPTTGPATGPTTGPPQ